jgi:uncharacterized membrane protein
MSLSSAPDAPISAGTTRIAVVDLARGAALVAMAVFHLAWDLFWLRFITTDVALHPGWRAFSHSIAASFLFLAGISLGLAHADGLRWRPFWRRLGIVAGAALGVSIVTRIAMPDAWVAFGILHCIAAASLMGAALVRLPWRAVLAAAAIVAAVAPVLDLPALAFVQGRVEASALFPLWQHLGLARVPPLAVDFVPIFFWSAYLLVGLAAGLGLARGPGAARLAALAPPPLAAPLMWAGRRSLAIYLIHQPVFIALLMGLAWVAPGLTVRTDRQAEARFEQECVSECSLSRDRRACLAACACVVTALRREPFRLRQATGLEPADERMDEAIERAAALCFRPPSAP